MISRMPQEANEEAPNERLLLSTMSVRIKNTLKFGDFSGDTPRQPLAKNNMQSRTFNW